MLEQLGIMVIINKVVNFDMKKKAEWNEKNDQIVENKLLLTSHKHAAISKTTQEKKTKRQ